jgi:hypothetical protein
MSSVRDTSLMAFFGEVEPSLGDRQMMVYQALRLLGPSTSMELSRYLGWSINRVTPRVFELRQGFFVVAGEKRPCKITGRTAYEWKVR